MLYKGIVGSGLSTLFRQWGTYNAIVNACGEQKSDCFSVTYVFDADILKRFVPASPVKKDVYYTITVFPIGDGTSHSLCETLYSEDSSGKKKTFSYLEFRNGAGQISVRTKNGIQVEKYESGMLSTQELVRRQITAPQRYLPSFVVREAINAVAGYSKFNFDKVRQPAEANDMKRLISTGENLSQLLSHLNNNYTFQYEKIRESHYNVKAFTARCKDIYHTL